MIFYCALFTWYRKERSELWIKSFFISLIEILQIFHRQCVQYAWIDSKTWSSFVVMEHVRCVATVCQNVQYAEKPSKEESCFIEQKIIVGIIKISFHISLKRNILKLEILLCKKYIKQNFEILFKMKITLYNIFQMKLNFTWIIWILNRIFLFANYLYW